MVKAVTVTLAFTVIMMMAFPGRNINYVTVPFGFVVGIYFGYFGRKRHNG